MRTQLHFHVRPNGLVCGRSLVTEKMTLRRRWEEYRRRLCGANDWHSIAMSSDRNPSRMVHLLHVLLLFVACLQGFGHDLRQIVLKRNEISMCDVCPNCFGSEDVGEFQGVASSTGKPGILKGDKGPWQMSEKVPHEPVLALLATSESSPCSGLQQPWLQRQPTSQLAADSTSQLAADSRKLLTVDSSVPMESKTQTMIPTSFLPSENSVYNESPQLLHPLKKILSPRNSHLSLTTKSVIPPLPPTTPYGNSLNAPDSTVVPASLPPFLRGSPNAPWSSSPYAVHRLLTPAPVWDIFSGAPSPEGISPLLRSSRRHPSLESPTPSRVKFPKVRSRHPAVPTSSPVLPLPAIVPAVPPVGHHPVSSRHHSPKISPPPPSVPVSSKAPPPSIHPSHGPPIATPPTLQQPAPPSSHRRHHHHRHHSAPPPPPTSPGPGPKTASSPFPTPPGHGHASPPVHTPPGHGAVPPAASQKGPVPPAAIPPMTLPSPPPNEGHKAVPPAASQKGPVPPAAKPPMTLPPPPPNEDCGTIICLAPLTKTPLGAPCGCVRPIQVEIELSVALYALFPLISVLAEELADGTLLSQSQVQIMGANANSQDQEKSVVDIDLVPLDQEFDNLTVLLIFEKFWDHQVPINATLFGNYTAVYVHYPGLPPSPPSTETINGGPAGASGGSSDQPIGVDVNKKNNKLGIGTIAVIALSSAIAVVIALGAIWLVLLKCSFHVGYPPIAEPGLLSSRIKRSGAGSILSSDVGSSTSMSFASSIATYASSARTFTLAELERATDKFKPENIVGEGGFGRVFCGVLDDGTKVAVKVLTRDDQQGGKEFVAEVEMLSRLHHRNLVKLIGICTEEHSRCLVYELIHNGSVESHLHGVDKETAPLDWDARMKIALGAARGLAYLHEDSNPRVIHRDFKASNILLENDFTPKVSDFGLAKAAPDEGSGHLSTRVMGTFGYVAPEYAMTGHLLVKSDVYSYGVVLLELLSGRKPVDMSQPPGQENLVTWARPLLTSKDGLKILVDPALENNFPFDNMARVAAIASMCVQPEVSHRPFMGEVVQALKLVYNDSDANNGIGSANGSQGGDSPSLDGGVKDGQHWVGPKAQYVPDSTSFVSIDYDSGPSQAGELAARRPVSASALLCDSTRLIRQYSGSFRRHSISGPLRTSRSKPAGYRVRGIERGSLSEHALMRHFGTGFDREFLELWP